MGCLTLAELLGVASTLHKGSLKQVLGLAHPGMSTFANPMMVGYIQHGTAAKSQLKLPRPFDGRVLLCQSVLVFEIRFKL